MDAEEKIKEQLARKFDFLRESVAVKRARRIFVDVQSERFSDVLKCVTTEMPFSILCTITGLDEGETFGIIYHLASVDGLMLNLRTHLPRGNPVINTVTGTFPGADSYERELIDLFGIEVTGLADGPRYPLPDNWPKGEYPLRKGWKGAENV